MRCAFVACGLGIFRAVRALAPTGVSATLAMMLRRTGGDGWRDGVVIRERQQFVVEKTALEFQWVLIPVSCFVKAKPIDGDDRVNFDSLLAIVERIVPRLHGGMLIVERVVGKVCVIVET